MAEVLQILLSISRETPLPTLLVIGGITFLFFSIAEVKPVIIRDPNNKKTAARWGTRMLLIGVLLFAAPPISTAVLSTPTPTLDFPPTVPSSSSPPSTVTDIPTAASPPSPTQSCDQLKIEDFKITSPTGTHGPETDGTNVPQLREDMPVTWEPSYCPLTIKVFRGGVPVRTYEFVQSGEITTDFIMQDYPSFVRGYWIEIKVWIPEASLPSDNVHIKLP